MDVAKDVAVQGALVSYDAADAAGSNYENIFSHFVLHTPVLDPQDKDLS